MRPSREAEHADRGDECTRCGSEWAPAPARRETTTFLGSDDCETINEIWGRIEPSVTVRRAWVKRHRTGRVANAVAKGGRVAACVIA